MLVLNLVSSPGAGKTSLLVKTLEALREQNVRYASSRAIRKPPTTPSAYAGPACRRSRSTPGAGAISMRISSDTPPRPFRSRERHPLHRKHRQSRLSFRFRSRRDKARRHPFGDRRRRQADQVSRRLCVSRRHGAEQVRSPSACGLRRRCRRRVARSVNPDIEIMSSSPPTLRHWRLARLASA